MTDFTITPKAQNVFLESWLDLPETDSKKWIMWNMTSR